LRSPVKERRVFETPWNPHSIDRLMNTYNRSELGWNQLQ
jgi:hypothetical protein